MGGCPLAWIRTEAWVTGGNGKLQEMGRTGLRGGPSVEVEEEGWAG